MFSKIYKFAIGISLRGERLIRIANEVEHLTISELQKRKFHIASLVRLFVFLIEVAKTYDEEETGIGRQSNGSLYS